MKWTIEIPESFIEALKIKSPEVAERRVTEALAIDFYRSGNLSRESLGEWLKLTSEEVEAFLGKRRLV
jgi:hypothetical protein